MVFPLTCDQCGCPILAVGDGWIEWLHDDDKAWGLRLIHHLKCHYHLHHPRHAGLVADEHLSEFMEVNGIVRLFDIGVRYELPREEIERMILRLNQPGYDEVFRYADEAAKNGIVETDPGSHLLMSGDVALVKDWLVQTGRL